MRIEVHADGLRGFAGTVAAELEKTFAPGILRVLPVLPGESSFGGRLTDADDFEVMLIAGENHVTTQRQLREMAVKLANGLRTLAVAAHSVAGQFTDRDVLNSDAIAGTVHDILNPPRDPDVAEDPAAPDEPPPPPHDDAPPRTFREGEEESKRDHPHDDTYGDLVAPPDDEGVTPPIGPPELRDDPSVR